MSNLHLHLHHKGPKPHHIECQSFTKRVLIHSEGFGTTLFIFFATLIFPFLAHQYTLSFCGPPKICKRKNRLQNVTWMVPVLQEWISQHQYSYKITNPCSLASSMHYFPFSIFWDRLMCLRIITGLYFQSNTKYKDLYVHLFEVVTQLIEVHANASGFFFSFFIFYSGIRSWENINGMRLALWPIKLFNTREFSYLFCKLPHASNDFEYIWFWIRKQTPSHICINHTVYLKHQPCGVIWL